MILSLGAGLVLLVLGAELLVRGAARLAAAVGVSALVIGLTVVAFGTSSPELAVSVQAAWMGSADIAVGNVVGSNIFNVLFILGVSALVAPLAVAQELVRRDVPLLIAVSAATLILALDGAIGVLEGGLLAVGLLAYTVWCVHSGRRETKAMSQEDPGQPALPRRLSWPIDVVLVLAGLGLLVLGASFLVEGATALARWLGASEVVIGLTVVAAGTSLPELATSVLASVRGQRDIAVGNIIGSNLFNLMGVLGLSAVVAGEGLAVSADVLAFDLPVMIAAAVVCLPVFFTGRRISRWEGILLLAYYVAYVGYLIIDATGLEALAGYRLAIGALAALTAIMLVVPAVRAWGRPSAAQS